MSLIDMDFAGSTVVKNLSANAGNSGDTDRTPESGRSSEVGNGNLLQYSCLGNPMDRGAWQATIHGVTESDMTEQPSTYLIDTLTSQ